MVRHVRTVHGWDQYQRTSYYVDQYVQNQRKGIRSTIKLPPDEKKQREQSRRDAMLEEKRQEVAAFKEGKGGRPPKPIRSGRPPVPKAL